MDDSREHQRIDEPRIDTTETSSGWLHGIVAGSDDGLEVHGTGPPGRSQPASDARDPLDDRLFFVATKGEDGTYSVALTEDGMQTFETALGIADDLGGNTRISSHSTIADIMDRTATREELSAVLRSGDAGSVRRTRTFVLRRRLRGSENPSAHGRAFSHFGKMLIVAVIGLWALQQFATAIGDIEAIPGILANIPSDILHFHPTSAFGEVGNKIADAGTHVLWGVLGVCLAYLVAKLIRPFGRIYRKDQLVPGERLLLRGASRVLRNADERSKPDTRNSAV